MAASFLEKLWALLTLAFACVKLALYAAVVSLLGAVCWKLFSNPDAMGSGYYVIGGLVWCCFFISAVKSIRRYWSTCLLVCISLSVYMSICL